MFGKKADQGLSPSIVPPQAATPAPAHHAPVVGAKIPDLKLGAKPAAQPVAVEVKSSGEMRQKPESY